MTEDIAALRIASQSARRARLSRLTALCATGVGIIVEIIFVVDAVERIRQVVLQFIAFDLIGQVEGFARGGTGWAIGSRHGVLLEQISKPRRRFGANQRTSKACTRRAENAALKDRLRIVRAAKWTDDAGEKETQSQTCKRDGRFCVPARKVSMHRTGVRGKEGARF
jgi:tRNA U34 2-thiouridine synthase MnmA/TrmU